MNVAPIAIRARGLRKAYRMYRHPLDALLEAMIGRVRHIERVALNDVDLDLRRGEIVGVLGRNGAGKSTLLKLIAGTLERSAGELEVTGRITAILELGTGFHPDYTGRENIYMGGLCLGMSRREIDTKIAGIIEFSELGEYIDQPFKTYSTGMQARLTFSTAISVDPDILIVDEALSVGDARFQLKCFARLQDLRQRQTTILLVSHDTNTITSLCDRALILEGGQVFAEGDAKNISVLYHNLLFGDGGAPTGRDRAGPGSPDPPKSSTVTEEDGEGDAREPGEQSTSEAAPSQDTPHGNSALRYGSGEARLVEWRFVDARGKRCSVIESGAACRLHMSLHCERDIDDLSFGFAIKDRRGTVLWGVTNLTQRQPAYRARAGERLSILADCVMWLAAGDYFVTLGAAHLSDGKKIDFVEDAIEFKVMGPSGIFTTSVVNLQTEFSIRSDALDRREVHA